MGVLIGSGGHASDILQFLPGLRIVDHHTQFENDDWYILGINDPQKRAEISAGFFQLDEPWVHPDAKLYHDVEFGRGTHINYGVTAVRTVMGDHCTIAPGVTICGDVTIGDRVFIGAGAVVVNLTTIPDDTFIKAGQVWTQR